MGNCHWVRTHCPPENQTNHHEHPDQSPNFSPEWLWSWACVFTGVYSLSFLASTAFWMFQTLLHSRAACLACQDVAGFVSTLPCVYLVSTLKRLLVNTYFPRAYFQSYPFIVTPINLMVRSYLFHHHDCSWWFVVVLCNVSHRQSKSLVNRNLRLRFNDY